MKSEVRKILVSLIAGVAFSVPILAAFFFGGKIIRDKELYCDLNKSIFAEREYVYPILRDLGYDPSDYGQTVENPITTKSRYSNCL